MLSLFQQGTFQYKIKSLKKIMCKERRRSLTDMAVIFFFSSNFSLIKWASIKSFHIRTHVPNSHPTCLIKSVTPGKMDLNGSGHVRRYFQLTGAISCSRVDMGQANQHAWREQRPSLCCWREACLWRLHNTREKKYCI